MDLEKSDFHKHKEKVSSPLIGCDDLIFAAKTLIFTARLFSLVGRRYGNPGYKEASKKELRVRIEPKDLALDNGVAGFSKNLCDRQNEQRRDVVWMLIGPLQNKTVCCSIRKIAPQHHESGEGLSLNWKKCTNFVTVQMTTQPNFELGTTLINRENSRARRVQDLKIFGKTFFMFSPSSSLGDKTRAFASSLKSKTFFE